MSFSFSHSLSNPSLGFVVLCPHNVSFISQRFNLSPYFSTLPFANQFALVEVVVVMIAEVVVVEEVDKEVDKEGELTSRIERIFLVWSLGKGENSLTVFLVSALKDFGSEAVIICRWRW